MTDIQKTICDYIDQNATLFSGVSDRIWELAELSLKEYQSAALYCEVLREGGFSVEERLCGVETAFSGSFGSGKPAIGILGEFDALSGLSQAAGVAEKRSAGGEAGHGCNHNLLGAGALAAAFAVKDFLQRTGAPGTVIFFGCPGEEGGAGKAFMAREGAWRALDAAVTWHPDSVNTVVSGSCISCIQKEYIFDGIASHAARDPELGRSALDAAELLNIGVQFLREHMPGTARIHYAITDAGGVSPNVVQPHASVLYMIRDHAVADAIALEKRVDRIAEGAALMTDTKMHIRFIDGTSNTVPNRALEAAAWDVMQSLPLPAFDGNDRAFAAALRRSYEAPAETAAEEYAYALTPEEMDYVNRVTQNGAAPLNEFLMPYHHTDHVTMSSTDVGDVSWQTPTVQVYTACRAAGSPGHSWQNVAAGKSPLGHKGMLYAGKILACLAAKLLTEPETLAAAQTEFKKASAAGYACPIPKGAVPTAL